MRLSTIRSTGAWLGRAARRRPGGQRGQSLVLVALVLGGLLGSGGLALDGGNLYLNHTNAQRTADSAALAGAKSVLASQSQGITDAQTYAASNSDSSPTVTVSTTVRAHDTITVKSTKTVPTTLMRALKINSGTVSATAKAQVGPAGSAVGVIPWAINEDALVGYGVLVGLQAANAGGGCGTFNYVSVTPPGGQTYADAIVNGVNQSLQLNTNYPTNAFDGSGLSATTKNALQARINARPSETWNSFGTGSPRVVFVPIINGNVPNAPSPVQFVGFRAFFLDHVDNSCAYGRWVQATIPAGGIGGATVPDKGVYVVKLIS